FLFPTSQAIGRAGNLFIADLFNNRVRRVDATGTITTIAGGGGASANMGDNGPATGASLSLGNSNFFGGIAVDREGSLLIVDSGNNRIRRVDAVTKIITTV